MNISFEWLSQYLASGLTAAEAAALLTSSGLEVESIEEFEKIKGGLKGLIVGEVLETQQHPNADRLTICKVNTGETIAQIVCGAPNVAAGQKVIVATPGTKIYPVAGEPFEIKKSKIRGEVSEGMICAADEIGLGTDHDGILVLDAGLAPGTAVADVFQIKTDAVFSIGLTPNRSDAASHIGVARDLAAVINARQPGKQKVSVKWPEIKTAVPDLPPAINVVVEDKDCVRYSGMHIAGVKVGPSPDWLRDRLLSIGLNPINNVVDITNFVLYEMGQPLHAFDAGKIEGKQVVIKKLAAGTLFKTLDGVERKLNGSELMICDARKGMCIAGVFGGAHSGVNENTTEVFLESATFDPVSVRKTSRAHGLKTDASFRFERGTDPEITLKALHRAAALICEITGGKISSDVVDVYPEPVVPVSIDYTLNQFQSLTGVSLKQDALVAILNDLDITAAANSENNWRLTIPAYRIDVKRPADVSEEVLRIYGYENIPLPEKMNAPLPSAPVEPLEAVRKSMTAYLVSNGFTETMSNSLTRSSLLALYPEPPVPAFIKNPLSQELDILRPDMMFPLLDMMLYNVNRKNQLIKAFEFGKVYAKSETGYKETEKLAVVTTANKFQDHWQMKSAGSSIYYLKSLAENLLLSVRVAASNIKWETDHAHPFLDSQIVVRAKKNALVTVGTIRKKVLKHFDLSGEVFYAEVNLNALKRYLPSAPAKITEPPKFPEVRRDLSMVLDKNISYAGVEAMAFETERKLLRRVNVFDVYEGNKIEAGKKSYALSFFLGDNEKTLTDKEIDKVMQKLMEGFEKKLGAVIRKS